MWPEFRSSWRRPPARGPYDAPVTEPRRTSPWLRRSRRTAYENTWITVWHDEVTRPDGQPGIYGVVHFANLAVGVVAIDDDERVVLVGQDRYTLDAWSWEIPEGGVPPAEDPVEGARRELREETGFEAAEWREIGRVHLSNSVTDEAGILYLATGLTAGQATPDGTEAIEVRLVPFEEALAMTLDGRITDILSVAAIQRVALERAESPRDGTGRGAPRRAR
jgi:8-oxo-dGTP pyrophosphatase MutT (NUDIX family)